MVAASLLLLAAAPPTSLEVQARPSPFQEELQIPGGMRPARFRVMGATKTAGRAEAVFADEACVNLGRDSEDSAVSQRHVRSPLSPSVAVCSRAVNSMREQEDMLHKKFARQLVVSARGVAIESVVLSSLAVRRDDQREFLFLDQAPTTLRRHVGNLRKWLEFRVAVSSKGNPGLCLLRDFSTPCRWALALTAGEGGVAGLQVSYPPCDVLLPSSKF